MQTCSWWTIKHLFRFSASKFKRAKCIFFHLTRNKENTFICQLKTICQAFSTTSRFLISAASKIVWVTNVLISVYTRMWASQLQYYFCIIQVCCPVLNFTLSYSIMLWLVDCDEIPKTYVMSTGISSKFEI